MWANRGARKLAEAPKWTESRQPDKTACPFKDTLHARHVGQGSHALAQFSLPILRKARALVTTSGPKRKGLGWLTHALFQRGTLMQLESSIRHKAFHVNIHGKQAYTQYQTSAALHDFRKTPLSQKVALLVTQQLVFLATPLPVFSAQVLLQATFAHCLRNKQKAPVLWAVITSATTAARTHGPNK